MRRVGKVFRKGLVRIFYDVYFFVSFVFSSCECRGEVICYFFGVIGGDLMGFVVMCLVWRDE